MNKSLVIALGLTLAGSGMAGAAPRITPVEQSLVIQVQSDESFRINQLEEENRRLNGKVEELNFLLLQLQEKLRKMEEDYELRFQEIEEKQSSGDGDDRNDVASDDGEAKDRLEKPEAAETADVPAKPDDNRATPPPPKRDLAPRALGTLTFDSDGNVIDSRPEGEQGQGLPFTSSNDGSLDASEFGSTPGEVLQAGRQAADARDFAQAQRIFSAHRKAWPKDPAGGEVLFRLGEAWFWQKNYYESANVHLEAHKNYPESPTAADNLLGLGLALAGLNQREVACVTYGEVLKQYPDATSRLGERIRDEQASARC